MYASGSVEEAAPDSSPVFTLTSYFVVGPSKIEEERDLHDPPDPVEVPDLFSF